MCSDKHSMVVSSSRTDSDVAMLSGNMATMWSCSMDGRYLGQAAISHLKS